MEIAWLVTIEEAAQRLGLQPRTLIEYARSGKIKAKLFRFGKMNFVEASVVEPQAGRVMNGGREKYAHLEGQPISAREAERRYGIPAQTILRWAEAGLIRYLPGGREGKAYKLNEADVAYLAEIYKAAVEQYGHFRGRRIRKMLGG
jgi:predicted site-specific integrase-resolvase